MAQGKLKATGGGSKAGAPPKELLPRGVTVTEWALEKKNVQNPRIRALLGCLKLLDEVLESNFAILHCSPRRIEEIWKQVRKVTETMRIDVAPLLAKESKIPKIEEARAAAEVYMQMLEDGLFGQIDRFPDKVPEDRFDDLRRLLCVATGQLQSFLQDTLGDLLASDPRSLHDTDYFLSRRFALDVYESEWLHTSVINLEEYLNKLSFGPELLVETARSMQVQRRIPGHEQWQGIGALLEELTSDLTPALKKTIGLRGIRLSEMELLEHHATEIPILCRVLKELYQTARLTVVATEHAAQDPVPAGEDQDQGQDNSAEWFDPAYSVLANQMTLVMRAVEAQLRDLISFVPVWRQGIEHRRALSWSRRIE